MFQIDPLSRTPIYEQIISQLERFIATGVLKEGDEVDTKVIGVRDGKISLSIKALTEDKSKSYDSGSRRERPERVKIPKAEKIGTSLGDLMKDIKL